MVIHRYLAVCRECSYRAGRPYVQPFGSFATLNAWHLAHVQSTGHEVADIDGWPSPSQAFRRSFGDATYREAFGADAYRRAFGDEAYRAAFSPRTPSVPPR